MLEVLEFTLVVIVVLSLIITTYYQRGDCHVEKQTPAGNTTTATLDKEQLLVAAPSAMTTMVPPESDNPAQKQSGFRRRISEDLPPPRRPEGGPIQPAEADVAPQVTNRSTKKSNKFTNADVVTIVDKNNICCAIFKNPNDKQTHFYRYRYREKKNEPHSDCPVELKNIAAAMKLWGEHWASIDNIKICQYSCAVLEEPSTWLTRLETRQEDCQDKYGCRISFQDFNFISLIEKKVFSDLSSRILDCSISEDDLIYFNGQDDSNSMNRSFFDL